MPRGMLARGARGSPIRWLAGTWPGPPAHPAAAQGVHWRATVRRHDLRPGLGRSARPRDLARARRPVRRARVRAHHPRRCRFQRADAQTRGRCRSGQAHARRPAADRPCRRALPGCARVHGPPPDQGERGDHLGHVPRVQRAARRQARPRVAVREPLRAGRHGPDHRLQAADPRPEGADRIRLQERRLQGGRRGRLAQRPLAAQEL